MTTYGGTTLIVTWHETIDHPAWYRISFQNIPTAPFTSNVLADSIDTTLVATTHSY